MGETRLMLQFEHLLVQRRQATSEIHDAHVGHFEVAQRLLEAEPVDGRSVDCRLVAFGVRLLRGGLGCLD